MSDGTMDAEVRWHILMRDPDDLPDAGEPVMVTVENFDGERRTLVNILLKVDDTEKPVWTYLDGVMLWEKVVAWAAYPEPFVLF